jgi:hypothetical protein
MGGIKMKKVCILAFICFTAFIGGCEDREPEGWRRITTVNGTNRIIGTFYGKYSYNKDSSIKFLIDKDDGVWDISIWKDQEHKVYFNVNGSYLNVVIENSDNHIIALCATSTPPLGNGVRIFSKEKAPPILSEALPLIASGLYADEGGYLEDLINFLMGPDKVKMAIGGEGTAYTFTIDTTGFAELYSSL